MLQTVPSISNHVFFSLSITAISTLFVLFSGFFPYGIQCSTLFWPVSSLWPVLVVFVDTTVICDHFLHCNHRLRVGSSSKVSASCRDMMCIETGLFLGMYSLYG